MRIAALADIHANLIALEAVLHDLQQFRPDLLVLAGDLSHRFPWPRETIERIEALPRLTGIPIHTISGNSEVYLLTYGTPQWPAHLPNDRQHVNEYFAWHRDQLGPAGLDFIGALDSTITLPDKPVAVTHAIPGNPFLGIAPRGNSGHWPALRSDAEVDLALAELDAKLLICGHTHYAMLRLWHNTVIVNPGPVCSVHPGQHHKLQEGAQYAIIDWSGTGKPWQVIFRHISYNVADVVQACYERAEQAPWPDVWRREGERLARLNLPQGTASLDGTRVVMRNDHYNEEYFS